MAISHPLRRPARLANPVLLTAGLAVTGYAVVSDPGRHTWPGLAFAVFAVFEHINYFAVQLMHDTITDLRRLRRVGLRRSHLARDLATRNKESGHRTTTNGT